MKAIDFDFYSNVLKHLRFLARHSNSLLQNVDSNVVESLNEIIAKLDLQNPVPIKDVVLLQHLLKIQNVLCILRIKHYNIEVLL